MRCPSCGASLEAAAELANESRVQFSLSPHEGEFLGADTVGGTLTQIAKLLKAASKEANLAATVLLTGVEFRDGTVVFDLAVLRQIKGTVISGPT